MTPVDAPRVLIYCRQSERQAGEDAKTSLSLRSQEERGRQWAASAGGVVVGVIADHDLRGADAERPGIAELLATVRLHRVDVVWIFSLSRLARDLILQLILYRELERAGVGRIVSETEGGIDDPFIRGIHGLMHQQSTRQQSAHSKAAFARRARDGGFPNGPTPMGYVRPHRIMITRANGTSYERHTGEPSIDPETAPQLRALFQRFADGESLHALTEELARGGSGPRGGTWTRSTLRRILQSPIYAGDIVHRGVVVAHNDRWAIVDRALWDRVQAKLGRLVVVRRGERDSWLEGIVSHACGARMYYERYTGHSAGHGGMFVCKTVKESARCADERRIIGAALLERVTLERIRADLGELRAPDAAIDLARELAGGRAAIRRRAAIDKALQDARARWKRNHERFSAGKLPSATMDAEDALLAEAEAAHPRALADLPAAPDAAAIIALHAALQRTAVSLSDATTDRVRTLLDDLSASVVVGEHGVRIVYGADSLNLVIPAGATPVPKGGKGFR